MADSIVVAGIEASRGHRVVGFLPLAAMASGAEVRIPVHIVSGVREGPAVCLVSLLHGPETFALEIIREVLQRVNPEALNGALVAIPIANPLAFDSQSTLTPSDGLNLNHVFSPPGRHRPDNGQDADLTIRTATLLAEVVSKTDCVLDYHCGTAGMGINYVYVPNAEGPVGERTREIARAYGLEVMYLGTGFVGSIEEYCLSLGIPALHLEIGGGIDLPPRYLEGAVTGVLNVLRYMGMLEGRVELPKRQVLLKERQLMKARYGGILHTEVALERLNDVLSGGDVICRVISPATFKELEVIRAPYERTVTFMLRGRHAMIQPGNTTCFVGNIGTAEVFENR